MATPQSTTSQDAYTKKPEHEQVTFRFCSECSNMLYPKEDEEMHKLQFTCRTCFYTEDAQTTCVFRNVLHTSAGETAGVTQDVGSDPTVSLTSSYFDVPHAPVICLFCGHVVACETCGRVMDVKMNKKMPKETRPNEKSPEEEENEIMRRKKEEKDQVEDAQTLDELIAASSSPFGFGYDSMDIDDFDSEYGADQYESETSELFGDGEGMTLEL